MPEKVVSAAEQVSMELWSRRARLRCPVLKDSCSDRNSGIIGTATKLRSMFQNTGPMSSGDLSTQETLCDDASEAQLCGTAPVMDDILPLSITAPDGQAQVVRGVGRRSRRGEILGLPEHFVRRMDWVRRDGLWRGEWTWETYNRLTEWVGTTNLRWRSMRLRTEGGLAEHAEVATASKSKASIVPQEVLLIMVDQLDHVRNPVYHDSCAFSFRIAGPNSARSRGTDVPCVVRFMRTGPAQQDHGARISCPRAHRGSAHAW